MSIIKAIKQQLGLSVTPANNFTLDASADNGSMKLARNSGQDIMTVNTAGKVTFPNFIQNGPTPQTWQSFDNAARWVNTQYTNNTGRDITVLVGIIWSSVQAFQFVINGVIIRMSDTYGGLYQTNQIVVPAGATYQVNAANATTLVWEEFR